MLLRTSGKPASFWRQHKRASPLPSGVQGFADAHDDIASWLCRYKSDLQHVLFTGLHGLGVLDTQVGGGRQIQTTKPSGASITRLEALSVSPDLLASGLSLLAATKASLQQGLLTSGAQLQSCHSFAIQNKCICLKLEKFIL